MSRKPSTPSLALETNDTKTGMSSPADVSYCCHKSGSDVRNLIVCIDGTANQFGQKNTNVIEFYNLLRKEDRHNQLTWYNSGIGTYARPSWKSLRYYRQVIDHKIDLAIAWNFERTVLAAYRWLSDNYKEGDRIFLFGFSRGAFQVRVLSAMIHKVGLIHKGNEEQIPFAYELYADPQSDEVPGSDKPLGLFSSLLRKLQETLGHRRESGAKTKEEATNVYDDRKVDRISMAAQFKQAFSHENADPHFVGAWDTVSSIGVMRGKCMLPGTIDGMKHVCYFRHALALDERRVKFTPEYAYGGSALRKETEDSQHANEVQPAVPNDDRTSDSKTLNGSSVPPPHTLEVWFAGTHSDIGGGNAVNESMDRSRPPLRWMVFESVAAGLRTKLFDRVLKPSEQIELQESLTGVWWILEMLPLERLTYTRKKDGKKTTIKPHLGAPRKIHPGQKIHRSLTLTDKDGYVPKARPVDDDPDFWANARTQGLGIWKADDVFEGTKDLVEIFMKKQDLHIWDLLRQTAITVDGRQAVYDGVLEALGNSENEVNISIKLDVIRRTIKVLKDSARVDMTLRKASYKDAWRLLHDCWKSDNPEIRSCFQSFKTQFLEPGPRVEMEGHTSLVSNISISADGSRVVSGSWDNTIRIWDSETGVQIGESISGHQDYIHDVAFSPDGKLVASASADQTVCLWDAETGKAIGEPLKGHTDWVRSVAFSPDSKRVVSGSDDNTLRVWDVATGESVGDLHKVCADGEINAVAFHPNGKLIASASRDGTVRIWDVETSQQVGEPLKSHDNFNWAYSVVFSPDGKHIASGSLCAVYVWDLDTRVMVRWPFLDHRSPVRSVAFSPDGWWIVSSGDENTALVWNIATHVVVSRIYHHTNVKSIAFFPDGKSIASACADGLIRIWDSPLL